MPTTKMIMDIPQPSTLDLFGLQQLLDATKDQWRSAEINAVVLPIVDDGGVYIENSQIDRSQTTTHSMLDTAKECRKRGLDVYFSVVPSLGFLNAPHLHIVDIANDTSAQICVTKEGTRNIVSTIVTDALELARGEKIPVRGIVLDACDLWPMGAKKSHLELTCFCPECRERLEAAGVNVEQFQKFPSPWNLLLMDSGTGISYEDDVPRGTTAAKIVELSKRKGFDSAFSQDTANMTLEEHAKQLLRYMNARDAITVDFIRNFFERVKSVDIAGWQETAPERIVLAEASHYNWTGGMFYSSLDDDTLCDEVWSDPSEQRIELQLVHSRTYLWRRARYFLDAWTSLLRQTQDMRALYATSLGRLQKENIQALLTKRSYQTLAGRVSGNWVLNSFAATERHRGFVTVGLNEDMVTTTIRQIGLRPTLADVDPREQKGKDE